MDIPEVIQSIQNGVHRWKATGSALVMISPVIRMCPEIEKYFHAIDLPLPGEQELYALQDELGNPSPSMEDRQSRRQIMPIRSMT